VPADLIILGAVPPAGDTRSGFKPCSRMRVIPMANLFHMRSVRPVICTLICAALFVASANPIRAANESTTSKIDRAKVTSSINRAADYLKQAQAEDGSFSSHPGITAIAGAALLRSGRTPQDPVVARVLKYLEGNVQDDGGIYQKGSNHKNYETCLAIVCLTEANKDRRYDKLLAAAEKFVKKEQWDEDEGKDLSDLSYGGAGYGSSRRPDLSNTSFLIDALHSLGRGKDDPAIQKALVFVSRCQNLESDQNTSPFAAKVNDGGFYYTVAAGGQSMAGQTPEGGLRSYGSMTYAGLKSMIYAGVTRDDPRVKAAYEWIKTHYTLDENPGMGASGLYYYYHTFAKALDAIGEDTIVDASGKPHNWRADLADRLATMQNPDGNWVNKTTRWFEGDPNLVTAYCLLTLSYCRDHKQPPVDHILSPPKSSRRAR
jgi:squalene-hopene/tetraprenyl-beta-curcumene cyclase